MDGTNQTHCGLVLGYDPGGGSGRNGVACLEVRLGEVVALRAEHLDSVNSVLSWMENIAQDGELLALGIDTMLSWSGSKGGLRAADRALRKSYPASRTSILGLNSLYGAMCASGPLLALRLRVRYPHLSIFEAHPKVAFAHLFGRRYEWRTNSEEMKRDLAEHLILEGAQVRSLTSEDEFDAVISALTALYGLTGKWPFDLYDLHDTEGDQLYWIVPGAKYPWPTRLAERIEVRD